MYLCSRTLSLRPTPSAARNRCACFRTNQVWVAICLSLKSIDGAPAANSEAPAAGT